MHGLNGCSQGPLGDGRTEGPALVYDTSMLDKRMSVSVIARSLWDVIVNRLQGHHDYLPSDLSMQCSLCPSKALDGVGRGGPHYAHRDQRFPNGFESKHIHTTPPGTGELGTVLLRGETSKVCGKKFSSHCKALALTSQGDQGKTTFSSHSALILRPYPVP